MNDNDTLRLLQDLLNTGRLMSPIVFNGVMYKAAAPISQTQVPSATMYDLFSGWAFDGSSSIGGLRSLNVDNLIRELEQKGYPEIAKHIPVYHVCRWWQPPESIVNWAIPDPTRFALPEDAKGLGKEQLEQTIDNLRSYDQFLFVLCGMGGGSEALRTAYRGEKGRSGFAPVRMDGDTARFDFSPAPPPGYRPNMLDSAVPRCQTPRIYTRMYQHDQEGNVVPTMYQLRGGPELPDHFSYDLWWDVQTDANVARYWRNWAASVGAQINPE